MIKLGLIGNHIGKSKAPFLIKKLVSEFNLEICYELFDQKQKENLNIEYLLNFFKKKILLVLISHIHLKN